MRKVGAMKIRWIFLNDITIGQTSWLFQRRSRQRYFGREQWHAQNPNWACSLSSVGKTEFATSIAEDYLDDLAYFDEKTKANANTQCFLLSIFGPFLGRQLIGYFNIYFAPEKDQIDSFKELLFGLMDKRLEALERDVKFLSLEVDKLMQKRKRQDGYLNDTDKERMEELQRKILPREKQRTSLQ